MKMRARLALTMLMVSCSVHAAQVKTMREEGRISFEISGHEINRLQIRGDRIAEWVSGHGKMSYDVDESQGSIFLKPLVKEGVVYGTLTTERGSVQDVSFHVKEGAPETLILVPRDHQEGGEVDKTSDESESFSSSSMQGQGETRKKAISLVQRLLAGEGKKTRLGQRDSGNKGSSLSPLKKVRVLRGEGLEAILYRASKDVSFATLSSWKQEGDVALGSYRGQLVVVRRDLQGVRP